MLASHNARLACTDRVAQSEVPFAGHRPFLAYQDNAVAYRDRSLENRRAYRRGRLKTVGLYLNPSGPFKAVQPVLKPSGPF